MVHQFRYAYYYIKYLIFARHKKGHGIHSPFVYELISQVFREKKIKKNLSNFLNIYNRYKKSDSEIEFVEIGAGSVFKSKKHNKIGEILLRSSINKKYGRLLFNIVDYFKPYDILELGTSIGISTSCISLACTDSKITSIEGVSEKLDIAKKIANEINQQNINFIHGNFDTVLISALESYEKLDFVFFDGNHQKESTLKYFNACLKKAHNDTIFVFDDIHWSKGMDEAWEVIKNHKDVRLSIDLFRLGLIFFKKELSYEQYVIKF